MTDEDFGGDEDIVDRDIKPANVIPFPDLRPNAKLGQLWADEMGRANKGRTRKVHAVSPLDALADLERQRRMPSMAWPAGWDELGKRGRMYAGQCMGIVGPTGGGKTSFAMQIALANAAAGVPVLWLPKELDAPELDVRIAANLDGQHTAKIRDEWGLERFRLALASVDDAWRYVDNVRDLEEQLSIIRLMIQAAKRIYRRPPLLVVDYMGKFGRGQKDSTQAVANAAEFLREIMIEEEAIALLLGQPNRFNNETLTGKRELDSAADAIAVAGESSEIEHACSVMIGLNVFKKDDAEVLDAHVLVSKARNTGREGREGFRFSKPGGVWKPIDHLPATPGVIAAELKKATSIAKKAKLETPTIEQVRATLDADISNDAEAERGRRLLAALRAGGLHGLAFPELKKVPGVGRHQTLERSLQLLAHRGLVEKLIGSKTWRLVPQ